MNSHLDPLAMGKKNQEEKTADTEIVLPRSQELIRPKPIAMRSQTAQIQAALVQAALKKAVLVDLNSNPDQQDDALDMNSISLMVEDIDALRKQTASPEPQEHKQQAPQQAQLQAKQSISSHGGRYIRLHRPYVQSSRCFVSTQQRDITSLTVLDKVETNQASSPTL